MRYSSHVFVTLFTILVLCGASANAKGAGSGCTHEKQRKAASRLTTLPCIAGNHTFTVEASYYQNASRVGDTNLAAYPDARVGYGVLPDVEAYYDAPSEIAESRLSLPSYFLTRSGYGFEYENARSTGVAYTLTGEVSPPSSALSNPRLISTAQLDGAGYWPLSAQAEYGFEVGVLQFGDGARHRHHTSLTAQGLLRQLLGERTLVTAALEMQSRSFFDAGAQTGGVLGVERALTNQLTFDAQLGSTFNPSAESKPHYIGLGFIVH